MKLIKSDFWSHFHCFYVFKVLISSKTATHQNDIYYLLCQADRSIRSVSWRSWFVKSGSQLPVPEKCNYSRISPLILLNQISMSRISLCLEIIVGSLSFRAQKFDVSIDVHTHNTNLLFIIFRPHLVTVTSDIIFNLIDS